MATKQQEQTPLSSLIAVFWAVLQHRDLQRIAQAGLALRGNQCKTTAVINIISLILSVLEPIDRRRAFTLVALCVPLAIAELAGVLGALPFILLASNPDSGQSQRVSDAITSIFGDMTDADLLVFLGFAALFIMFFSVAFRTLHFYLMTRFSRDAGVSLQTRILAIHLRSAHIEAGKRHGAHLQSTVLTEVEEMVEGVILNFLRVATYFSTAICILLLLVVTDPIAGLVMLVVIGAGYMTVFGATRRIVRRMGKLRVRKSRKRYRLLQEAMWGRRELQLAQREEAALKGFHETAAEVGALRARMALIKELPRGILELLIFGCLITLTLWLLTSRDDNGATVLPVLAIYALSAARLFPVLQRLYKSFAEMQITVPALRAIAHELDRKIETGPLKPVKPLPLEHAIRFENVTFTYPDTRKPALSEINLKITAKTTVGIVGETGAGKSTAVDLLLGLTSPKSGKIWVDDVVITPENRRSWQTAVGYVPQDFFLADGSIAENIAFGYHADEIDRTAVTRAVARSGLSAMVSALPQGIDTEIGERGVRLSGGERQRIAIARALYRDPALLVFDEATSALDTVTELAIMQEVRAMGDEKTIVIIAHRLSTVRTCDTIFLFDKGRLADSGPYDDLLQRNDRFRALHEAQP